MNMEAGPVVEEGENGEDLPAVKQNNTLPIWGNKETMNINQLILKNIRSSPYFKQDLYRLKTYHEVVDEIYYKVTHLEPWEKNSRKLASQIGHAGEVRGVSAGGIVSSPFCLLYKLFTLKLSRKQLQGLLDHADSPYIRGLGFMYIRYCQPPSDFLTWFEPYFDDDEMIDLKAGSGFQTTIGEMCKMLLLKLDWFGTLFPRIPVSMEAQFKSLVQPSSASKEGTREGQSFGEAERRVREERDQGGVHSPRHSGDRDGGRERRRSRSQDRAGARTRSRSRERRRRFSRSPDRRRSSSPQQQDRSSRRSRSPRRNERSPGRRRSLDRRDRSPERGRRRSRSRERDDRRKDRNRSKERVDRRKDGSRSTEQEYRRRKSRSREREDRKRDRSRSREREDRRREKSRSREREDRKRDRSRSRERDDRRREKSRSRERGDRKRDRSRSRERDDRRREKSRSREREDRKRDRSRSRERDDRRREKSRSRERESRKRDRSRSRERDDRRREKSRSRERSRHRERSP